MLFSRKSLTGIVTAVVLAVAAGSAAPAAAQDSPLSIEGRTGVTIPMGDLSDAGAEPGLIFGVDAFYVVGEVVSVYGGWGYHQFSCDDCIADVTAAGPRAGVKILYPVPGAATPWFRTGLTFNSAEGLADVSSDRAVGFEAGAGIDYALSPRLSVTPAVRYAFFDADFGAVEPTFSYLTLDLGLHFHF